ncbi:chitin deacetylase [Podila verticillata]|nr:chitin deacetylase [Podila verticillata]
MVKVFITSLTVLVLSLAAVNAQTGPITAANYPPPNQVPDINSAQVQAWLKEIDLTGVPPTHLNVPDAPGGAIDCAKITPQNDCYSVCDECKANDDITTCGLPNSWGITFDDGPSAETPRLLDYLMTHNIKASFFVIGGMVVQYPDILRREVQEGHHLAGHTWSHYALTSLTNEQIVAEIKWTEKAVFDVTGLKLKYMRPPYGDINNRVRFILKKLGYIVVDWTGDPFDTNDWKFEGGVSAATLLAAFTKSLDTYVAGDKSTGFYCLEHDRSASTVNLAQQFIPLGTARNITFHNVPACQHDVSPYQSRSVPGNTTSTLLPTSTISGTSRPAGSATSTPSDSHTPVPTGSSANFVKSMSIASAFVAIAVGFLFA